MGLFSWWKGRRSGSPEPAKAAGGSAAEFAAAGSHGAWRCGGSGSGRLRTRPSSSSGRRRSPAPLSRSRDTAPSPTTSNRAAGSSCRPQARARRSSASSSDFRARGESYRHRPSWAVPVTPLEAWRPAQPHISDIDSQIATWTTMVDCLDRESMNNCLAA
ncbi:hypothetical protein GUJ93_ZPchr0005g15902 [Zizania palustris]|uniref:Uncharacterized protein n=1 Tax=Zizania palustris TaxID=103762 RepID=A0A8J5SNH2_ZIZPA|nr:hypothetical protein GUJ93_ZPchr0005g15902 [Zizania palustris]